MGLSSSVNINSGIQLANLFLIGSPLALFISVNDLCPPTYINPSTHSLQLTNSTDDERDSTSNSHSIQNSITSITTSTSKHTGIDLDEIDPEALFSYFACRRVFNIFHSYDPVTVLLYGAECGELLQPSSRSNNDIITNTNTITTTTNNNNNNSNYSNSNSNDNSNSDNNKISFPYFVSHMLSAVLKKQNYHQIFTLNA
ncbi:unnamed protein product [Schistosoma margrebowiei]|uniref:Uncharacterized protein n=1 Tax=Schistosoma margrebowiei TaxID=48269 RepID=A0A183LVN5_9TREM|nr:unnamed protein product [Schistosoma margrebowiei]